MHNDENPISLILFLETERDVNYIKNMIHRLHTFKDNK